MDPELKIPISDIVQVCGGNWGAGTATDVGKIVKEYLYGEPAKQRDRQFWLGQYLLGCLEREIDRQR